MNILGKWVLSALVFLLVANVVPGVHIQSFWTALVLALLWGLVGITLKPILLILTLPINIVTLGLFTFVINAFFFWGLSTLVKGFDVDGFKAAFLGALVLTLINWALYWVFGRAAKNALEGSR
jgi:putative membrane protein